MLIYLYLWVIFILSIWIHEFAHAWTSNKLWDPTPKIQWRLTPNPFKHLDPIWFFAIFLINFGRGKPVQVNNSYYKNPWKDELIVALSGPASNIVLSTIWVFCLIFYWKIFLWIESLSWFIMTENNVLMFFSLFSIINIILGIFNMLPLPPLDGFRLIKFFYPSVALKMEKNLIYIWLFVLFLLLAPWIWQHTRWFIINIGEFIQSLFFTLIWNLLY